MRKKFYVVSDIYGRYDDLISALTKCEFDIKNEDHLLVVLGNSFNIGKQNLEVFNYLYKLTKKGKAIVLKGNHENILIDFMKGNNVLKYWLNSGFNETLNSFYPTNNNYNELIQSDCLQIDIDKHLESVKVYFIKARNHIENEYPKLFRWLNKKQYFLETENYIFTHSSLDLESDDWKKPTVEHFHYSGWEACVWNDGSFFGENLKNIKKKVVIGHCPTSNLRKIHNIDDGLNNEILTRKDGKIIAINGGNEINVFIVEDNLIE